MCEICSIFAKKNITRPEPARGELQSISFVFFDIFFNILSDICREAYNIEFEIVKSNMMNR